MEIRTSSGICITVDNSGPSKALFFDKSVRTVELTKEESFQVSSLLTASASVKTELNTKAKNLSDCKIITICGSMKFLKEMREIKKVLEKKGHKVKTPTLIAPSVLKQNCEDKEDFLQLKSQMMRSHMENIKSSDAVLILNGSKDMMENYIGVNTLLEIGIAFDNHIPIFFLNEAPKNIDEICAMNPKVVGGLKNLETSMNL